MALAPPSDYNPPDRAPDRVVVDGVRVPVCGDGVTVDVRKDGPAHITRHATVQTRYEVDGNFYGEWINVDLQGGYKPTRIQLRDHRFPDEWVTVMHGYLGAFGGDESGNVRFEVRDPAQLLDDIPAEKVDGSGGVQFGDAYVEDILRYVRDRFVQEQTAYDDVVIKTTVENSQVYDYDTFGDEEGELGFGNTLKKTFNATRHSLRDVLEWAQDRAKFRYWFQPTTDDSTIVLRAVDMDKLPSMTVQHTGSELGGTLDLVTNNALYQISPQNSLKVVGAPIGSRQPSALDSRWGVNTPPNKAYEVTVQYDPLVERAGGRIVAEQFTDDFATQAAVTNYARSRLKEMLDNASGGQITSRLAPLCSLFDRIKAHPVSQNVTQQDVPPLTYEIERVVHKTSTNKRIPFSQYDVSFWVNPAKITVANSGWSQI